MKTGPKIQNILPISPFQKNFISRSVPESVASGLSNRSNKLEQIDYTIENTSPKIQINLDATENFVIPNKNIKEISFGKRLKNQFTIKKDISKRSVFNEFGRMKIVKKFVNKMEGARTFFSGKLLKKINFELIGDITCKSYMLKSNVNKKKYKFIFFNII